MLKLFPGFIQIIIQKQSTNGFSFTIDKQIIDDSNIIINDFLKSQLLIHSQIKTLQHLTILFPWCNYVLKNCNFIEFDASFRAVKPYCFCVGNCIFNNQSYPIGLTIAPSESEKLYKLFVDNGTKFSIDIKDWQTKCLLSDTHPSLISFGKNFCFWHFFCQRHILEYFGTNSGLCIFVSKLLKCSSFEEYDNKRLDIIEDLTYLIKKRQTLEIENDEKFELK